MKTGEVFGEQLPRRLLVKPSKCRRCRGRRGRRERQAEWMQDGARGMGDGGCMTKEVDVMSQGPPIHR